MIRGEALRTQQEADHGELNFDLGLAHVQKGHPCSTIKGIQGIGLASALDMVIIADSIILAVVR